ncbi:MAG: CPBP family intramembrane metalloprotease [Fimbriimonadaceae bacterium]|nr:CPBP family intramembrane metalloprotease [Chthonomonadaceae bacterium]MCO5295809.1 CPBP family intramembrane metalloprotease [Fimbriimonadaceae bacterium]
MTLPTFDLPEPEKRNRLGWALLIAVVSFLVLAQLEQYLSRSTPDDHDLKPYETVLEMGVRQREALRKVGEVLAVPNKQLEKNPGDEALENAISDLAPLRTKNAEAAKLYVAMRTETGKEIVPGDLQAIKAVPTPENKAFATIYGSKKLDSEQLAAVEKALSGSNFLLKLARAHARERAGVKDPRGELLSAGKAALLLTAGAVGAFGMLFGLLLWPAYFVARANGRLKPLGHPVGQLTPRDSDRHAMRAAQVLLGMVALSYLLGGEATGLPKWAAGVTYALALLVMVVLLTLVPVDGSRITFRRIGVRGTELGKNVMWGVAGALANLPVVLILGILGVTMFRFLPPPEHPTSVELMNNPSLATILATLFAASVVAPIVEESVFRGTLLPAISAAFKHVPSGILLTSLVFASIHPTGIPAWPALAGVGAMAALLTYQTKSLVPAIVMHAVHNGLTLMLALAVSG